MITKKYSQDRKKCRVTFKLPVEINSQTARLFADFNNWVEQKMTRQKSGGFSLSVTLPAGNKYRFRYLLDDNRWENDPQADGYLPNPYESEDSLLDI
jgi:1,4-alpha-glucan branching enzyme